MKKIKQLKLPLFRHLHLSVALQLLVMIVVSAISFHGSASAGQLTARSMQLSDSGPSGGTITSGVGSGTNVAYKLTFTFASTSNIAGVVVDFCSNSALAGDSCTAPTGFNVNRSTTTLVTQTGLGTGSMSIATSDTTNNRIIISRATAATPGTTGVIEFGNGTSNGFTNPSSTGTIYARVYTYASQGSSSTSGTALGHNTASPTGYIDFGAMALSISSVVTITARVQENLTFCVSLVAPTSNCGGTSTPAVSLGHGTTKVIDSTAVDTGSAYTQISTNAASGAIVRMHNAYSCGGLSSDGGTTCAIPASGSGAATAAAIAAGTAAFGLYVAPGAALSGGSGTTTPDANYYNASHTTIATDLWYGMDTTTSGNNTVTTYGDPVQSCAAPVSNVNSQLVFAATASNVTPAGLYSTNMSLIATGTF